MTRVCHETTKRPKSSIGEGFGAFMAGKARQFWFFAGWFGDEEKAMKVKLDAWLLPAGVGSD
jgi:hypothetical protein